MVLSISAVSLSLSLFLLLDGMYPLTLSCCFSSRSLITHLSSSLNITLPSLKNYRSLYHKLLLIRELRSSGLLRSEYWYFRTDVSGQTTACPETSVRNYHYSLRNNPEGRNSHLLPCGSLKSCLVLICLPFFYFSKVYNTLIFLSGHCLANSEFLSVTELLEHYCMTCIVY